MTSKNRRSPLSFSAGLLTLTFLTLGAVGGDTPRPWPGEELSGGETTVFDGKHSAYGRALGNLDRSRWLPMRAGKRLFENPWHPPGSVPATAPRQGLGPLFNATACVDCHFRDGRGGPPESPAPGIAPAPAPTLLRWGLPSGDGDPLYGHQLNDRGLGVPPEGRLAIDYEVIEERYPNGETYALRRPRPVVTGLDRGAVDPRGRAALRIPPSLIGLGLLEAVPTGYLEMLEDPEDRDGDGISGRLQRIPGPTGSRVGRFGWKAAQPDLESQIARAFHEDMGVTSRRYPEANCPTGDEACLLQEGQEIELTDSDLHLVALYARLLAPPARRDWQDPAVLRGRDLFVSTGCSDCHRTELETAAVERAAENPSEARERSTPPPQPEILPELAGQTIRPFTDLLLHDMGPELADGIVEHSASASEWRTAPLWGLGLLERVNGHLRLLHDGRARTVEEAILWHGGEGAASREAYTQLPDDRRAALLQFLRSL